jgi:protein-tyrosine phosphatase
VISAALQQALRDFRHAPDRLLHRARRAGLLRRLAERPARDIGFVCHGNLCRSPYAEAAAARALSVLGPLAPRIWSAGLFGPDRPPPSAAVEAAREQGLDLARHRSRLLTSGRVGSDWIFVMEPWQASTVAQQVSGGRIALLGDLDPDPIDTRSIADPLDQPIGEFRACYTRIERCVAALARALRTGWGGKGGGPNRRP